MGTVATKQEGGHSPFVALMRTSVSLWIVVVMMAMSFGAGVIVKAIAEPAEAPVATTTLPANPGQIVAPPLTDEQIAGGVPSGHPDLSGDGSGSGGNGGGNGGSQGGGDANGGGQG